MRRASPPLAFTVRRFGVWRAALGALGLAGGAAMTVWWLAARPAAGSEAGWVALVGFACALLPLIEARRLRPWTLRWDGARWQSGPAAAGEEGMSGGRLGVAIDLGPWLLLRFRPEPGRAGRPSWIPLQRRGLETDWHALRCILYTASAAGPAPQAGAAAASESE